MNQIEMIEALYNEVYDSPNMLSFPETMEVRKKLETYLKSNYLSKEPDKFEKEWLDLECYITSTTAQYEEQGFINGFRCAVVLFAGGSFDIQYK